MSTTVRVETEIYRNYELRAVEWLGQWQVSLYPTHPDQRPAAADQIIVAATAAEAMAKGRWYVDLLADPHKLPSTPLPP